MNGLLARAILAFLALPGTVAFLLPLLLLAPGGSGSFVNAFVVMLAFHLRVVLHEEPWLARTHGEQWLRYKAQVPHWFGVHHRFGRSHE